MTSAHQKFMLDGKEYDTSQLSDGGLSQLLALRFATQRIQELTNHISLLQRAKLSYVASLKQEMLSDKAGFLFGDN